MSKLNKTIELSPGVKLFCQNRQLGTSIRSSSNKNKIISVSLCVPLFVVTYIFVRLIVIASSNSNTASKSHQIKQVAATKTSSKSFHLKGFTAWCRLMRGHIEISRKSKNFRKKSQKKSGRNPKVLQAGADLGGGRYLGGGGEAHIEMSSSHPGRLVSSPLVP